ncbi:MAG: CRISPR-associated protein Cas4 [Candidatus Thermoplasmatota archaeon]|nr:CRISPR-associated protein Cas4 [Candidatus Thermoplasmatota archaeon]
MGKEWISASDVEKFGYCPLSWWLSRKKTEEATGEELEEGKEEHEEIGKKLDDVKKKEKQIKLLENIILGLAVSSTLVSMLGLTFLHPERIFNKVFIFLSLIWLLAATFFLYINESQIMDTEETKLERTILIFAMVATMFTGFSFSFPVSNDLLAQVAQVVSLSWLVGASYWLKSSFTLQSEATVTRKKLKVEEGEIKYVDKLEKESKLLESEEYRLRGRPDYILEKEEALIPVEVKTGRVPEGPFFSHILQIAAYCLLVEEEMGKRPPYGLIRYGETEFDIDYDDDLEDLLLEKLDDMRESLKKGEVHRHHHREGKCENCSRRDICPESLV